MHIIITIIITTTITTLIIATAVQPALLREAGRHEGSQTLFFLYSSSPSEQLCNIKRCKVGICLE